jgi:UDP-N-acetylglucosamine 1-carboxyvinyltransferase
MTSALCPAPCSIVVRGGHELRGEVPIAGYKHALTVIVGAAVAMGRSVTLHNVPDTTESRVLERIVCEMGASSRMAGGTWTLDTGPMRSMPVPAMLGGLVHGSLYLVPAMLARFGEVSFAGAGGDRIGPPEAGGRRPTAQIGTVLERFGATVDATAGLYATASRVRGCEIDVLELSTHPRRLRGPAASSATKTALIMAATADGSTTLRHPVDRDATRELCDFLRACGLAVAQDGETWRVDGGGGGGRDPIDHHLISDSTEIVTYAACAARTRATLRMTGITGDRSWTALASELEVLRGIGLPLRIEGDSLHVGSAERLEPAFLEIECNGFSTDAHPLLALVLLGADGESRITDHVWTSRFAYTELLTAMGARLRVDGNTVTLHPSRLRQPVAPLVPTDSRAAAVAVVAGLGVTGTTTIEDAGHVDRSYERLAGKLHHVGARIETRPSGPGL